VKCANKKQNTRTLVINKILSSYQSLQGRCNTAPALFNEINLNGMEKTWRWFGKNDKIKLQTLRQIGVEGIVSALHDVPNGEIWSLEAINDYKII
jgi:hypothetical protein